jgi:hypothetical protein
MTTTTMDTPSFPVLAKYDDWELAAFSTEEDFFERSGCEEEGFCGDLEFIIDATGTPFSYDQGNTRFVAIQVQRDLGAYLRESLVIHLKSLAPGALADALTRFDASATLGGKAVVAAEVVLQTGRPDPG